MDVKFVGICIVNDDVNDVNMNQLLMEIVMLSAVISDMTSWENHRTKWVISPASHVWLNRMV